MTFSLSKPKIFSVCTSLPAYQFSAFVPASLFEIPATPKLRPLCLRKVWVCLYVYISSSAPLPLLLCFYSQDLLPHLSVSQVTCKVSEVSGHRMFSPGLHGSSRESSEMRTQIQISGHLALNDRDIECPAACCEMCGSFSSRHPHFYAVLM